MSFFLSLTVTSPCESVPLVMLLTEYNCSSVSLLIMVSIALNVASTGPLPSASPVASSPLTVKTIKACGTSPVSEQTFKDTSLTCSFSSTVPESVTSACKSSSKISCFLSARSLNRANAAFKSSSESNDMPSSSRRVLKALRPECLPKTMRFCVQPTSSARMISYVSRDFNTPSW